MKILGTLLLQCLTAIVLAASGDGYRISVQIDNYDQEELYLAYFYGDKQYIKDTVMNQGGGKFVFKGEDALEPGVYLVVMAPDNQILQVLVDTDDQHLDFAFDAKDPVQTVRFKKSVNNKVFYAYMRFLNEERPMAEALRQDLENAATDGEKSRIQEKLDAINDRVLDRQRQIVTEYKPLLISALIDANISPEIPEFMDENGEPDQVRRWRYTQAHYFDNVQLDDPRMLRTPFLFERVDHYVHKLQVQHPDTIAKAIEYVLDEMEPAEENFKFYLIHFLNEAAKSKVVGMDAVYVALVNKYYRTGKAPWTDEEQLEKILDNATSLEPLLIGKTAPDFAMEKRDGSTFKLHDIDSKFTVLYFWRYDCGACKKSTPHMKEFYEQYRDKGVEIVAVCFKFTDEVPACWEYVDENGIGDWIHAVDPYNKSRFSSLYYLKSTPQVYVLDKDKVILTKKIGADQLGGVLDHFLEMEKKEEEGGSQP